MLDGSSDPAAPVVQLDANSLRALSDALAPMILERVQRSLPTARATAREPAPAASQQAEDDTIALYPEHDDLADSESVSEDTSGAISEATLDIITSSYVSTPLTNGVRRELLSTHPLPLMDCLKPPKLDASMARLVRGDVVARDRVLSRFQRFTLDAAAPIIGILDQLASGESVDHDVLQTGLSNALKLLGNTHAHFSVERRQNVLKSLNPDLLHLASEDLFDEAAPNLFGSGFAKVAKERSDAMSALRQAKSKPNKPFFRKGGAPPYKSQGRPTFGNSRFQPYPQRGGYHQSYQGYQAFKAITAVKASTRARGKPQNPNPPTNRSPPSRLKSGIVGSLRPGNHSHGSQRPGKYPSDFTPLALGSQRPNPNPRPRNSPTCKFKPDGSGHALNLLKSRHGKLSGQQQSRSSRYSTPTSPTTTEHGHSIPDNGMEWSSGRPTFQVHPELETDYSRPLGAEHYTGPSHRVPATTTLSPPTSHVLLQQGETGHLRRGDQDAGERGHHSSSPEFTRGVLHVQLVFSTEERRGHETSNKPEGSQPICANRALQDGRTAPTQHHGQTGRLVHKGRSQGCILPHACPPKPSAIPEFPMGGENVPIYLPPIWISLSSEDIHKGDETSPCMPAAIGCMVHNVPGRSTDHGSVSGGDMPSDSQYTCTVPGPRLLDKLGEVNPVATAGDCIPRPCGELNDLDIVLASSEIARPEQGNSIPVEQGGSVGPSAGSHCGETQLHGLSRTACSAPLQGASEPENLLSTRDGIIRRPDNSVNSSQGRPGIVARATEAVERLLFHSQATRSNHPIRCIPTRVGSSISGPTDPGPMVVRGVCVAHKLPGVESSHSGYSNVPERPTKPAGTPPAGQHLGSGIHKPQRRDPLPAADETDEHPLGMVSGSSDPSVGHSPSGHL